MAATQSIRDGIGSADLIILEVNYSALDKSDPQAVVGSIRQHTKSEISLAQSGPFSYLNSAVGLPEEAAPLAVEEPKISVAVLLDRIDSATQARDPDKLVTFEVEHSVAARYPQPPR